MTNPESVSKTNGGGEQAPLAGSAPITEGNPLSASAFAIDQSHLEETSSVVQEAITADKTEKPKLEIVTEQELDEDEAEFNEIRSDLPGVKGASAIGIVTISVSRLPRRNEFFRTHPDFRPVVPLVSIEVGMEKQYFAVGKDMVQALAGIGIAVSDHVLYLTVTSTGDVRIIPIPCDSDNDYNRTKEIGLIAGMKAWFRLYPDLPNKCYRVFPAPADRFAEPVWPELKHAKIFRLGFKDKGRKIDSVDHPLFQKWAARDRG